MGNRVSFGVSDDPPCGDGATKHFAPGLRDVCDILGLPRLGVSDLGNAPSRGYESQQQCLARLAAILHPIASDQSMEISTLLISEFGSLSAVFSASRYSLNFLLGDLPEIVNYIKLLSDSIVHLLGSDLARAPVIKSSQSLYDYLNIRMANRAVEQLRALFLDGSRMLIKDEMIAQGTIDEVAAYPREIVKRALEVGARAIILVHNHPSGNSVPSKSDIELTRAIVNCCKYLRITIDDHIVVARNEQSSMRSLGLI